MTSNTANITASAATGPIAEALADPFGMDSSAITDTAHTLAEKDLVELRAICESLRSAAGFAAGFMLGDETDEFFDYEH